jgi:hypothetical protein
MYVASTVPARCDAAASAVRECPGPLKRFRSDSSARASPQPPGPTPQNRQEQSIYELVPAKERPAIIARPTCPVGQRAKGEAAARLGPWLATMRRWHAAMRPPRPAAAGSRASARKQAAWRQRPCAPWVCPTSNTAAGGRWAASDVAVQHPLQHRAQEGRLLLPPPVVWCWPAPACLRARGVGG